jgi:hypothetical protein
MNFQGARALQEHIAETYPYIDVTLKQIGNQDEWICYLDKTHYFLWSNEDWQQYEQVRKEYLAKYTEEEHEKLRARMKDRATHRKRVNKVLQQLKTSSQVSS